MEHKFKVGDLIERTRGLRNPWSNSPTDSLLSIIVGMTVFERPIWSFDDERRTGHYYVRYILKTGEIDICSTVFLDKYYSKPETPDGT